jgi:hypothetical protein
MRRSSLAPLPTRLPAKQLREWWGATSTSTARMLRWGQNSSSSSITQPSRQCWARWSVWSTQEYRLDHVYSTLLRPAKGDGDPTLCGTSRWHSGPQHWPRQWHEYHVENGGNIQSGLTFVAYELRSVGKGADGMGSIPGSHGRSGHLFAGRSIPCQPLRSKTRL